MARTIAGFTAGGIEFRKDPDTFEHVLIAAPVHIKEDFLGYQAMLSESGSAGRWLTVETDLNLAMALVADLSGGGLQGTLDSDSSAQQAVLYCGDQRNIDVSKSAGFEARVNLAVLPTTGVDFVCGLAGDHNATRDSIDVGAWFRCQASGALLCESDDTTNNNDDVAAGITLVAGTTYTFYIDFSVLTDVKFYVNNVRVCADTTFDLSNLATVENIMQPYIGLGKASGTGVGTMYVNMVQAWCKR